MEAEGSFAMNKTTKYLSNAAMLSLALVGAGEIGAAAAGATPVGAALAAAPAVQANTASSLEQQGIFARVGDAVITQDEYRAAFSTAARGKFYHGKPPDSEIAVLQREVAEQLVSRVLLLREARQRGLHPDDAEIQKTIQTYDQRYAASEQWKKSRAQMLPPLVARMEQESLLNQLESATRALVTVDGNDAKSYYLKHPEKFTEPEQLRVSVILLKVDPSTPTDGWLKVDEEVQAIVARLRGGADFAAQARQYSGDSSAQQGGDMGYLHTGMLPEATQTALSKLKPGEITDTVRLLEGIAVFQLADRKAAKLHEFDTVKVRAQELAQREQSEKTWTGFVAGLKKQTPAQVDQSRFLPMVEQPNVPGTVK